MEIPWTPYNVSLPGAQSTGPEGTQPQKNSMVKEGHNGREPHDQGMRMGYKQEMVTNEGHNDKWNRDRIQVTGLCVAKTYNSVAKVTKSAVLVLHSRVSRRRNSDAAAITKHEQSAGQGWA